MHLWLPRLLSRFARTTLVLVMLVSILWNGLPSTPCVCADGQIKLFCTPSCGGNECCCSRQETCSGKSCCHGHSEKAHLKTPAEKSAGTCQQISKRCCCRRLEKPQTI